MFMPKIESTFSLYAKMMLGVALIFQMPTAVYFSRASESSPPGSSRSRSNTRCSSSSSSRPVVTPTGDPMTQTMFAAPMIVLYLISIVIAWIFGKKKKEV